jgi:molybdate transport system substrate-binding protein
MPPRGSFLVACACLALTARASLAADQPKIIVFAAASLREAFEAAAPAFTKKTGIVVTYNFGGSDTLATQIAQGAPSDIFASANDAQMKRVTDAGLAIGQPKTFARNRLVVIAAKADPMVVATVADLAKPGVKVILTAPSVPIGNYSRTAFKNLNGVRGYPADFAGAVEKNIASNELDVKAVVTKITLGEGDAGVVYATDVTPAVAAKVIVLQFPSGAAPEASYPIVALKASASPSAAQSFVTFVLSADGQAYLQGHGFLSP